MDIRKLKKHLEDTTVEKLKKEWEKFDEWRDVGHKIIDDDKKLNEIKPEIVYRIIDKDSGNAIGSYSRANRDEYDFKSIREARGANCHGAFEDKEKYKIAKYKITYTLIEDDCKELSN